ncbi:hypothetical protein K2173_018964 [Erythroxylum novogranatense]|uniref:DYW domain-containing protein n=1 Tax=Erythroxylum novogranatense TaxID=1862640 RepID=A0AAV8SS99_9ROSI|nr:hypothetical protein K2173_018964 [Erythroxylum novogranatense]
MIRRCPRSLRCFCSIPSPQNILFQCNKRIRELGQLGRIEEARQLLDTMPHTDTVSWNSMISSYVQNNCIQDAKLLFDAFEYKNVRTWTILLSGYAKAGFLGEAEGMFRAMPERNVVSWNAMLSGYVQNGDIRKARKLFEEMPERNVSSWNSLITGYSRGGLMKEARELFDRMRVRNCVSWMLMISGYVEIYEFGEAWGVFLMMMRSGMRPNQAILAVGLSATMGLNNLDLAKSLRTLAIKTSYEKDVVVGTAILNAYARNGKLESAIKFFEAMTVRNEYAWTTMIAAFSRFGRLDDAIALYELDTEKGVALRTTMITAYMDWARTDDAKSIFSELVDPNIITWNAMVSGYAQNGMLEEAYCIFLQMPIKNAASWAAMVAGFVQNGNDEEGLRLFSEIQKTRITPSHSSYASALSACAKIREVQMGKQIHSLIIKMRCQWNSYVANSLLYMYAKCQEMGDACQVLNAMRIKHADTWSSLMSGLSENQLLNEAHNTFDKMPIHDLVSWTIIISAHVQSGNEEIALQLFFDMLSTGVKPEACVVASLLTACGSMGVIKVGEQIHSLILKLGLSSCLSVCNALITMYFKCGSLCGLCVFEEMPERDIISWNAVLVGAAQNGLGREAIKIFKQMETAGYQPNEITFTGVLCACSHGELVDEGWAYFISMSQDHGIIPSIQHYTCMVDLLGRAGQLLEAEALITNMPVEADCVIWEVLLAASRIHQHIELSERVGERLFQIGTKNSGTYIVLSNVYASQGLWGKVAEIRELMRYRGVTREQGVSWIQIKNKLHRFLTGDKKHEDIEEICLALKEFCERFKASDYVPDVNFARHDVEEGEKENELLYHSEKLAVAYAVLRTPNGSPIHIMKNLRICIDCHSFMKFVSKATQREIIIRDRSRFHHIQDGSCSCNDYW